MSEEIEFASGGAAVAGEPRNYSYVPGTIDSFDAGALEGVEELGDVIPQGSKLRFKAVSYKKGSNKPWEGEYGDPDFESFGEQPWVMVQLVCQQEPFTQKRIGLFCGLVNKATGRAAAGGDKIAQRLCKRRLKEIKSLMSGADYKAHGSFDAEQFLNSQPDLGIEVAVRVNSKSGKRENVVGQTIPLSKLK